MGFTKTGCTKAWTWFLILSMYVYMKSVKSSLIEAVRRDAARSSSIGTVLWVDTGESQDN